MSERHDHSLPEQPVDARLDSLLRRTLGQGRLSAAQRARHLAELDLLPLDSGSGNELMSGVLPPVAGSRQQIIFDSAEARAGGRSRRQLLELVAVVVALALGVGFMLTLLWESRSSPDTQPVAAPEPFETPAPFSTVAVLEPPPFADAAERLYVVSQVLTQTVDVVLTTGRISAIDPATGRQVWALRLGPAVDALLSPDGAMLYAAGAQSDGAQSELLAVDAVSGQPRWRVEIPARVWWSHGAGPTGLVLSADGARLHVLSCAPAAGHTCDASRVLWLTIHDSASGEQVESRRLSGCLGTPYLAPDDRTLYLACEDRPGIRIIDIETGRVVTALPGYQLVGSVVSPDGRWLYVIGHDDGVYQAAVFDMSDRAAPVQQGSVALVGGQPQRFLDLVTISPDGSRLFLGVLSSADGAAPIARNIFVVDAVSLQDAGRMTASPTITAPTLAPAADNRSVFAAHRVVEHDPGIWARSTIMRFGLGLAPQTIAVLEHEEVWRLLSWTAAAADKPPISRDGASLEPGAVPISEAEVCPVTPYTDGAPSDPRHAVASEHWYGNETGDIWAGVGRGYDGVWVEPHVSVSWWRDEPAPLTVTMLRMGADTDSAALFAAYVSEHDPFSTSLGGITFPAEGCWEVTATNGSSELRLTVDVSSRDVRSTIFTYVHYLDSAELEREALLAMTGPDLCSTAAWAGPDFRSGLSQPYPWYLDGDGLALGTSHGALFTGANDIIWLASGGLTWDEQIDGPGTLIGDLLYQDGMPIARAAMPVEVRYQLAPDWGIESGIRHAWVTTVDFPAPGCWQVQAAVGEHTLEAVVYVRALP